MGIEKYKMISVCKLKKGFVMNLNVDDVNKSQFGDGVPKLTHNRENDNNPNSVLTTENNHPINSTTVEKQPKDDVVKTTKEQRVDLANICQQFGADEAKIKAALQNAGINCEEDGTILFNEASKKALEDALKEYQKPKANFTEDTPPGLINFLQNERIINKKEDGSYEVLDNDKLQSYLKQDGKQETTASSEIGATQITTTTTRKPAVEIPDDLSTSRKARKETRKKFEEVVKKKVETGEVEAQKEYIIATSRHNGAINRAKNKLDKECDGSYANVLNKFLESGAVTSEEKKVIEEIISKFSTDNDTDKKILLQAWNTDNGVGAGRDKINSFEEFDKDQIETAKRLAVQGIAGFDKDTLLTRMAVKKVMDGRSERAKRKDNEWFIENQAERITNSKAAEQKMANTVVYFSKAAAKSKDNDPSKNHVYIGDYGKDLITAAPRTFCDEIDKSNWDESMGPKVTDKKGVIHYFKFNQNKYNEYCDKAANTADLEKYAKDNNLTLKEARKRMMILGNLRDIDGNEFTIEQKMGNHNGKVGNGELNKFRHFIEKGGTHVDKNPTNAIRAAYFLGMTGLGALTGFLGAGAVASAAGNVALSTAAQVVPGFTAKQTIKGYTIKDNVTFNFNGKEFKKEIIHNIDSQDVNFEVPDRLIDGQSAEAARVSKVPARNAAAITGGVTGLTVAALTAGKIHFGGRTNDWMLDTDIIENEQKQTNSNIKLDLGQTIYTMKGAMNYNIEADDEAKLKQHNLSHNQVNVAAQQASKLKANHVITQNSNEWGDDQNIDVYAPPILNATDVTSNAGNGQHRVKYKKLSDSEVATYKQQGKIPQNDNGPFYILEDVLDEKDNNKSIKTSHDEIYRLKAKPQFNASDGTVTFSYQLTQGDGYAGSGKTSVQKQKVQKWWH